MCQLEIGLFPITSMNTYSHCGSLFLGKTTNCTCVSYYAFANLLTFLLGLAEPLCNPFWSKVTSNKSGDFSFCVIADYFGILVNCGVLQILSSMSSKCCPQPLPQHRGLLGSHSHSQSCSQSREETHHSASTRYK